MGTALIKSGGEGGRYTVELEYDLRLLEQIIADTAKKIIQYEARIVELEDGPAKDLALGELAELNRYKGSLDGLKGRWAGDREAWCVDRSEYLTGKVGTIEIPGETKAINLMPGGFTGQGVLTPTESQRVAAFAFNFAVLPGWQRWMPTYRYGEITQIDCEAETCTVILESATSTQQGLNVDPDNRVLKDVPVEYMDCDIMAFSVGDVVVVRFQGQSWDNPIVIGYKIFPKGCGAVYCSTMLEPEKCAAEPLDTIRLTFGGIGGGECWEEKPLETLTDGLDGVYEGLFGNVYYDEEEEKTTVDYIVSGLLCDRPDNEIQCPEICGWKFACCFKWADVNPETIPKNDSRVVSVVRGKGPYYWQVAGTGATIDHAQTAGLSNTVRTDNTACGAITVTVTDDCGNSCEGSLRCTTGRWSHRVLVRYNRWAVPISTTLYTTRGKYRYYVRWFGAPPSTMCDSQCRGAQVADFINNNPFGVIGDSVWYQCMGANQWFMLGYIGLNASHVGYQCGGDGKTNMGIMREQWVC